MFDREWKNASGVTFDLGFGYKGIRLAQKIVHLTWTNVFIHPSYKSHSDYNLALIKMDIVINSTLVLNYGYGTICLPPKNLNYAPREYVFVSGWGTSIPVPLQIGTRILAGMFGNGLKFKTESVGDASLCVVSAIFF